MATVRLSFPGWEGMTVTSSTLSLPVVDAPTATAAK
jgi:hypothetical protein